MLIEFSVSNYRSIGENQVLSLIPSLNQKEYSDNIISKYNYKILNAIGIYGNNASGKSNFLNAFELLDKLIYISARSSSTTKLPYKPFLLREGFENKPTKFEIVFIIENNRYRLGVEYNRKKILKEWLYRKVVGREVMLYERENDNIDVSSGFNGSPKLIDAAIEATRENSMFISTCDMLNIDEAKTIFSWFNKLVYINGVETEKEEITTVNLWENESYRTKIKEYINLLNLNIKDLSIVIEDFDASKLPQNLNEQLKNKLIKDLDGSQGFKTLTTHQIYNKEGEISEKSLRWALDENESEGTKKAFHLSGPIIKTLLEGGILIIDETEAKMHPIMTINTINLFLNSKTNPNNAQIVFATHDTNILTYCKLRRDQINFIEKNNWESSEIYSLSDFKYFDNDNSTERPDVDKEKRYFEGRYGAIPVLGSFATKMEEWYG